MAPNGRPDLRSLVRGKDFLTSKIRLLGFLSFFAGFGGQIPFATLNADLFEEGRRGLASSKDPNKIVGNLIRLSVYFEDHGVRFDLHRGGIEHHLYFAFAHAFL